MTVTFCGHRDTVDSSALYAWLQKTITEQIAHGANTFFLGGYGSFDRIAATAVWELKKNHPEIVSILVLPYPDKNVDTAKYDMTTYPPLENVPRRFAISRRNRWMVDNANVVITNVSHEWGGAAQTLKYAIVKGKLVLNYSPCLPQNF